MAGLETVMKELFSFWPMIAYVVFAAVMIAIWICVGLAGGPAFCFRVPKPPPVPEPPKFTTKK